MGVSDKMWLPKLDTILECDMNFEKGSNAGHGALTPSVFSENHSIFSDQSICSISDDEEETLPGIEKIKPAGLSHFSLIEIIITLIQFATWIFGPFLQFS